MIQLSAIVFTLVLLRRKKITLWSVCVTTRKWGGFFVGWFCVCVCVMFVFCPYALMALSCQ